MDKNLKKFNLNTNGSWLNIEKKFDVFVNLYVDNLMEPLKDGINIAFVCEPQSISNIKNYIIKNKNKYDVILTHNEEILNTCENSEMFEFGTSWIRDLNLVKEKSLSVSFLVGGKSITEGHKIRHKIWDLQDNILIPKNFFNSSHFPYKSNIQYKSLYDKKELLFSSKFHICIENCKEKNYFSEKLIDSLYSKTIPIYWGCPNIGDWFNLDSIIIVNSVDEIIDVCNNLTDDFYNKKLSEIDDNFNRCKKFIDIKDRIGNKIEEILKRYGN